MREAEPYLQVKLRLGGQLRFGATAKTALSPNLRQHSHPQTTRPFITATAGTPHLSSSSFDLSVWLWGVLYPWIMVMCCSQWMLITHANEHARAEEEEGDEGGQGWKWRGRRSRALLNIINGIINRGVYSIILATTHICSHSFASKLNLPWPLFCYREILSVFLLKLDPATWHNRWCKVAMTRRLLCFLKVASDLRDQRKLVTVVCSFGIPQTLWLCV